MGLKPLPRGEVDRYKSRLESEWRLPIPLYKVLEAVFRETMRSVGYVYQNETAVDGLRNPVLSNQERLKLITDHVLKWENENSTEYGFQRIHINEYHEEISGLFNAYYAMLDGLANLKTKLDGIQTSDKDVFELQKHLHGKLSRIEKIVKPEVKEVDETKLDYFTKYLGISRAIYYDVFGYLDFAQIPFNRFASSKIIFEHRDDVTVSRENRKNAPRLASVFSPERIKGRISGNRQSYESTYKALHVDNGVVGETFLKFIVEQRLRLFDSSSGALPMGKRTG